jgi:thioredoxin 1
MALTRWSGGGIIRLARPRRPPAGEAREERAVADVQKVGDADFQDQVLGSSVPVVVDFFATWCGPCRLIAPIIDELSKSYAGKVKFVKVDIDDAPGVAEQFAVASVPTLVIFKDGQEADRRVGAAPKPAIEGWIKATAA